MSDEVKFFQKGPVSLREGGDALKELEEKVNLNVGTATLSRDKRVEFVNYSIVHLGDDSYMYTATVVLRGK